MDNVSEEKKAEERQEKVEQSPEKVEEREKIVESAFEQKESAEEREAVLESEKMVQDKLEKEIKTMQVSPQMQDDAKHKAQKIKDLDEKGKIMRLLQLVDEKGVAFAVQTARKMKDPYILDIFHDVLTREETHKKLK